MSNPKGINQYTKMGGGSGKKKKSAKSPPAIRAEVARTLKAARNNVRKALPFLSVKDSNRHAVAVTRNVLTGKK